MPTKRKSAYFAATQATVQQDSTTVSPSHSEEVAQEERSTVEPSYRETPERLYSQTVTQRDGETVQEKQEKTSFYLRPALLEKLDDLAHEYRKRTGHRINRNDIVRHLVEGCSLDSLAGLKPLDRKK